MLKTRVMTSLLLLAGLLAIVFLSGFAMWLAFAGLVAGIAAWEWGGLVQARRGIRQAYAGLLAILCPAMGWFIIDPLSGFVREKDILIFIYGLSALFWVLIVPFCLRARWGIAARMTGLALGGVVLIPSCLALIHLHALAPMVLLAAMAIVWIADIAAYFCGRRFGRHKLAPMISPGKTWEGVAGALIGVVAYGVLLAWGLNRLPGSVVGWMILMLILLWLAAISILGDLFESFVKRQANVKDSGTLLPGHGGVLDRIDSLTSTLPLVGLMILLWDGQSG